MSTADDQTRIPAQNASADADQTRHEPAPPADPDHTRFHHPPADPDRTRFHQPLAPDGTVYDQAAGSSQATPSVASVRSGRGALPEIPGHQLLRRLGSGGMGTVYLARELQTARLVAVKLIRGGAQALPEHRERFFREARAAARLDHPHLVPVYEVGESEGQPYFTMPYMEGGTLQQRLQGKPLPARQAAELLAKLCDAVQQAHERGIIHRDIKPGNVLLQQAGSSSEAATPTPESPLPASPSAGEPLLPADCVPRLSDFGLARLLEGEDLTATGELLGTPGFMAPEQAGGKGQIGPGTDVYGLGALLYALLTGRAPFQAATQMETVRLVLEAEPVAPRVLNPEVPVNLETICLKCLHKEASRRYGSARELGEDLGRFLRHEPVQARPVSRWQRGWMWARRNPAVASLTASVLLVLLAGITVSTLFALNAQERARQAEEAEDRANRKAADEAAARQESERLKKLAEAASQREKTRAEEAERERTKEAMMAYAAQLREAQGEIERGRLYQAQAVLRLCDPKLCAWEHDYLLRATQKCLWTGRHTNSVYSVCFSPDGKRLASASWDQTVKVWDLPSITPSR